jgi:5,10-methenyltetrahydrofolate synthetase
MDPLQARKQASRAHFRSLQSSFSEDQYRDWNRALAPPLLSALKKVPPQSMVGAYRSRAQEASLLPVFGLPFRFCFPKVVGEGLMEFRWVPKAKEDSEFETGAFGILEPRAGHPLADPCAFRAAFVPLLAFDSSGGRLGYGKGFYDRVLADFSGLKIGVAFEWQHSSEALPMEAHDQRLDMVVTEKRVREFG